MLTTPQIIDALFTSTTFGQRRLLRLLGLNLVTRFRPQKPHGGSYPFHWIIDQAGAEVIAAQRGEALPRPGQARLRRVHLTSRANLAHLTGVNGFFTSLAGHARRHPDTHLDEWWPAARFQQAGAFYRVGDDVSVSHLSARLRPDGHGMWRQGQRSVPFYLEHDTGTEPLGVLIDKVDRYGALWAGTRRYWPVLFHLPSARREMNLHQRLADRYGPGELPVATCSAEHLAHAGLTPAEAVWWLYGRQGPRHALIELPNGDYEPGLDKENPHELHIWR